MTELEALRAELSAFYELHPVHSESITQAGVMRHIIAICNACEWGNLLQLYENGKRPISEVLRCVSDLFPHDSNEKGLYVRRTEYGRNTTIAQSAKRVRGCERQRKINNLF